MPSKEDLLEARLYASLTAQEAAALTGRHVTTWRRMERGQLRVDPACLALVSLLSGDMGRLSPVWDGWLLARDGLLYSRHLAKGFHPHDILHLPWLLQLSAEIAPAGRPVLRLVK